MKVYLGLGSNVGCLEDQKLYLEQAIFRLRELINPSSLKVSPVYQTPALLPPDAQATWNKPFLNLAIELECRSSLENLLDHVQMIEKEAGRTRNSKWAPRELDIDILFFGDSVIHTDTLTIPHSEMRKRAFVLDPLKDLNPNLKVFAEASDSVLTLARRHPQHAPIWMGIINVTPDSFSDGGRFDLEGSIQKEIHFFDDQNIGIIDVGGESTRPGAQSVTPELEWQRLKPVLQLLQNHFKDRYIRPMISVDTRHFETALKSLEFGIDIINDVSGLADDRLAHLVKESGCYYILTHSLSVPADSNQVFSQNDDVMSELKSWFTEKIQFLISQGVAKEKLILDPGIGFGKTGLQSQILLQNIDQLLGFGTRILVGHSRKSFLTSFAQRLPEQRDQESVGVSLAMIRKGIDILRVHNPLAHMRAFQGWNHVWNDPS